MTEQAKVLALALIGAVLEAGDTASGGENTVVELETRPYYSEQEREEAVTAYLTRAERYLRQAEQRAQVGAP